ncbi:MAG: chorismate mutase [Lachnospiraceae bacterium]|nr:chorismate mutase [Lachnospiraceae bacterium]
MTLQEIREEIDAIDLALRDLLLRRLDCSAAVAQSKMESGDTQVLRTDREAEVLGKLGEGVPEEKRLEYLAIVRKILETSRMYQYGLMYRQNPQSFEALVEDMGPRNESARVTIEVTRPDRPGSMAQILSMIGDHGYSMEKMVPVEGAGKRGEVTFELTIWGNLRERGMERLLCQLAGECIRLKIKE